MKSIFFLSYGNFPNGDAASIRLYCIAKLFMLSGFRVRIITMSKCEAFIWHEFSGIEYISLRSNRNDLLNRIKNVIFYGIQAKKIIESIDDVDSILITSPPLPAVYMCKKLALKHGYDIYADRTEWYSPSEFFLGYFSPQYIENDILTRNVIDSKWKVIAISKYLRSYFKKKGIKSILIPAIMDTIDFAPKNNNNKKIVIIYAGSPAKKDSLAMMIEGLKLLDTSVIQMIEFRVFGITKDKMSVKVSDIPKQVIFHGRVPRERVLEELRDADFTTLLRDPSKRFTKAGFPSKVAESLSSSTPIITNLTSDLGDYLIDEKNAIIVEDYSMEMFAKALLHVTTLDRKVFKEMQEHARETAIRYFDYRVYEANISQLISM